MRRGVWGLTAVALLLAGGGIGVAAAGWSVVHPERVVPDETPTDLGFSFERWTATTRDDITLVGWWVPASDAPSDHPTVVFLHGVKDSKAQVLDLLPALHGAGYNVLAFDFRAHGESGGDASTLGHLEVLDAQAALDRLESEIGPGDVALLGWSMGGATAIRTAARDARVDAVIADSSFADLPSVAGAGLAEFTPVPGTAIAGVAARGLALFIDVDPATIAPVRDVATLAIPVLLIQGTQDEMMAGSLRELAAADPGARVLEVEGAGHVASHRTAPERYESAVLAFLRDAFTSTASTGDPPAFAGTAV